MKNPTLGEALILRVMPAEFGLIDKDGRPIIRTSTFEQDSTGYFFRDHDTSLNRYGPFATEAKMREMHATHMAELSRQKAERGA